MTKPLREYAWEYFFNNEALQVEEILAEGGLSDYEKSRLRIAFEENVLKWETYKQWFMTYHSFCSLKDDLSSEAIARLGETYNENKNQFQHFSFLNHDLIALKKWDDHTVILGINYSENLKKIPKALFVLCSPTVLKQIIDPDYSVTAISNLWSQTESKHFEYSTQARKNFDGFLTLKIQNHRTEIFKMDDDLSRENIDSKMFSFSLLEKNPFTEALRSGKTQTFSLDELDLKILDYTTAVITPLKKGKNTVGFLLGLKMSLADEADKTILENISAQAS